MATKKKRRGRRLRPWVIVALVLAVVILLVVCITTLISGKKKVVFTIGDEKVYASEVAYYALEVALNYRLTEVDMLYEMYDGVTTYEQYYKDLVQEKIIQTKIMYICAKKQGITLDKEDKEAIADNIQIALSDIEPYMEQYAIEEDLVADIVTEKYYADLLMETVLEKKENKESYFHTFDLMFSTVETNDDGTMKLNPDGSVVSVNQATKEQQYALAMKAVELSKEGKSLQEVAEELQITHTAGDIYGSTTGYDSETYLEEVMKLQEGEVSSVVEGLYGYHVFVLISKDDQEYAAKINEQKTLEENAAILEEKLLVWEQEANVEPEELIGEAWETFTMKDYIVRINR